MLIDEWMPAWDASERHATRIAAPPEQVWRAARELDFSRSPLIRGLFALRSLPALLTGQRRHALGGTLAALERNGFVRLGEAPGSELLLGVVGRFWRPSGGILRLSADEIRHFDRPGYAIGVWNFTLQPQGDAVRLATETRVRCTDPASRGSFLRYWRVIGPFSALTRREMLRAIRTAAEASPAAGVAA